MMYHYSPLAGWVLRRIRVLSPLIVTAVVIYLGWKYILKVSPQTKYHKVITQPAPTQPLIPEPEKQPSNKWVIALENVISIPETCMSIQSTLPDWNIVIIHLKPKPKFRNSRCSYFHHLNEEKHLLNNGWVKAFNYAIQERAKLISIVTDLNHVGDLKHFKQGGNVTYLQYNKPQESCSSLPNRVPDVLKLELREDTRPGIQGFVQKSGFMCSSRAPGLALCKGVFSSISSSPIAFHSQAFWAGFLALPQIQQAWNVMFYFVNKLLWMTDNNVYVRSNAKYWHEDPGNKQLQELQEKLCQWRCKSHLFLQCFTELLNEFSVKGSVSAETSTIAKEWIQQFAKHKHLIPSINFTSKLIHREYVNLTASTFQCQNKRTKHFSTSEALLKKTCSNYAELNKLLNNPWIQFNDVVLIVTFNNPNYRAVPYFQLLYSAFFQHIIYCGAELQTLPGNYSYSFVPYGNTPEGHFAGSFNYKCASIVMNLGYNVSGYLVMGDDVLLSVANIAFKNRDSVWYLPKEEIRIGDIFTSRQCRLGFCDSIPRWRWWEDYRSELLAAFAEMEELATKSDLFYQCYSQLVQVNGAPKRANGGYADLYYIPGRLSTEFSEISKVFLKRNVFLELAVPTIITCLETQDKITPVYGFQDQYESRDRPWENFEKIRRKTYIHPSKLGPMAEKSMDHILFYCQKVFPFVYDQYGRINVGNMHV